MCIKILVDWDQELNVIDAYNFIGTEKLFSVCLVSSEKLTFEYSSFPPGKTHN